MIKALLEAIVMAAPELVLLVGVAVLGSAILKFPGAYLIRARCRANLRKWLRKNRLEVVSQDRRFIFQGPFYGDPKGYAQCRLEVRDADGALRKGVAYCGDHRKGFLGEHQLDVRWDEELAAERPGAARLLIWTGIPFLSAIAVFASFTLFLSVSQPLPGPYGNHLGLGGLILLACLFMARERKRGFPVLRKVMAVDRTEFLHLLRTQMVLCGGWLLVAVAVFGASLRYRIPAVHDSIPVVVGFFIAFFGGLILAAIGARRQAFRLGDIPSPDGLPPLPGHPFAMHAFDNGSWYRLAIPTHWVASGGGAEVEIASPDGRHLLRIVAADPAAEELLPAAERLVEETVRKDPRWQRQRTRLAAMGNAQACCLSFEKQGDPFERACYAVARRGKIALAFTYRYGRPPADPDQDLLPTILESLEIRR